MASFVVNARRPRRTPRRPPPTAGSPRTPRPLPAPA